MTLLVVLALVAGVVVELELEHYRQRAPLKLIHSTWIT